MQSSSRNFALTVICGIFFSSHSLAQKHSLCNIDSNIEGISYSLDIEDSSSDGLEENSIETIIVGDLFYSWSDIIALNGMPMEITNENNKPIIRISYEEFDRTKGGTLKLNYLKNGAFNKWSSKPEQFDLIRSNASWELWYKGSKHSKNAPVRVHKIHFKAKKIFGVPYGIKKVSIS